LVDSDEEFLTNVMRRCKHLTVHEDGTKVRAVSKLRRTTLILRDIPRDIPEEEVKEIFDFPDCGPIVGYKPEVGDTWFVTFENEKDCESASIALLSRTFKGKPIRCRIKSETQRVRYASRAASTGVPYWTPFNASGARGFNVNAASYTPTYNPQAAPYNANAAPYNSNSNYQYGVMQTGMYYGNYGKNVNPYGFQPPYNKSQQQDGRRGRKSDGQYNNHNKGRQYGHNGYKKGRKNNNNRKKKHREPVVKQVAPVAADFPALEGASVVAIPNTLTRSAAQVAAAAKSKPRVTDATTTARSSAVAKPVATPVATPVAASRGNTTKPTRIIYNKKEMSSVIANCIKTANRQQQKPPKIPASSGVARRHPLQTILINEPFPIIYPASPSPELAAQSVRSSDVVPFLALDDYMPSVDNPQTVRQEDIAAAVGKVQGIEVPARPADTSNTRSHRAKSGASRSTESEKGKDRAKKSHKGKASCAPEEGKDTDGFTTVKGNRKDRRKRGGHGGRDGQRGSYGHGHGYGHGQGKQGSRRSDRREQRGKYGQDKAHGKVGSKAPRKHPKASKPAAPAKKVSPVTSNGKLSFAALLKKKPASQKPVSQAKAP